MTVYLKVHARTLGCVSQKMMGTTFANVFQALQGNFVKMVLNSCNTISQFVQILNVSFLGTVQLSSPKNNCTNCSSSLFPVIKISEVNNFSCYCHCCNAFKYCTCRVIVRNAVTNLKSL